MSDPTLEVQLSEQATGSGAICRKILDALPDWFGYPSAVDDYCAGADERPSVIAWHHDDPVGILTVRSHSPHAPRST